MNLTKRRFLLYCQSVEGSRVQTAIIFAANWERRRKSRRRFAFERRSTSRKRVDWAGRERILAKKRPKRRVLSKTQGFLLKKLRYFGPPSVDEIGFLAYDGKKFFAGRNTPFFVALQALVGERFGGRGFVPRRGRLGCAQSK